MKRWHIWFLVTLLGFFLFFVGSLANNSYRFDLLFNPLASHVLNQKHGAWGNKLSLVPEYFQIGEPRQETLAKLSSAGFIEVSGAGLFGKKKLGLEEGMAVYLNFDEFQKLVTAESAKFERGCL